MYTWAIELYNTQAGEELGLYYSLVFAKNTSASRCFAGVPAKYSAHGGILGKDEWVQES